MDNGLEVNKAVAAVLVAGMVFMAGTLLADNLVHPTRLEKTAITIEGVGAPAAAPAAPAPLAAIGPLLASADPSAGEADVKKLCSSCHTFTEGGKAGVGPNLYNVVGGPHAHMEGFNYTNGMKAKQGPWTYDELNEWLHKPSEYVPGTRMSFAGINNDKERADVIDYLHTLSHSPVPLPPATAPAPAAAPAAAGAAPAAGAPGATAPAAPAKAAAPAK